MNVILSAFGSVDVLQWWKMFFILFVSKLLVTIEWIVVLSWRDKNKRQVEYSGTIMHIHFWASVFVCLQQSASKTVLTCRRSRWRMYIYNVYVYVESCMWRQPLVFLGPKCAWKKVRAACGCQCKCANARYFAQSDKNEYLLSYRVPSVCDNSGSQRKGPEEHQ